MKKQTLTWIAIGVLLFAGIVGMISREMKRQRGRALSAPTTTATASTAITESVQFPELSGPQHRPAALGVRYPHRQMTSGGMSPERIAIYTQQNDLTPVLASWSPTQPNPTGARLSDFPSTLQQPTIAYTFSDNDGEIAWVAGQVATSEGQEIQLFTNAIGVWQQVELPQDWLPGEAAFPILAGSGGGFVLGAVWTDALGASGISVIGGNNEMLFSPVHLRRTAEWQTWQPPDIRLIGYWGVILALRAEAPPRMSGTTREVDSAILGWRFDIEGPVPEPEILMPAIPGQFTERPVLAADPDGNLAVAIGHWGTPQPEGLRGYEMTILLAEGMSEWRAVTSPIPNQVNIATAQPQLGRVGDSLLLVYAFESNEIALPTAHRIQWVRSTDAGLTWTAPALLLPEPGPGVHDYPLDLIMGRESATLLLQRQTPAPERKNSIMVDPPTIAMFAAEWDWAQQ